MPHHLISDTHEYINVIIGVPIYYLAIKLKIFEIHFLQSYKLIKIYKKLLWKSSEKIA